MKIKVQVGTESLNNNYSKAAERYKTKQTPIWTS